MCGRFAQHLTWRQIHALYQLPESARPLHLRPRYNGLGRRQWQKASGYHRQGRVENTFFRYKSIIGDGLRARSPAEDGLTPHRFA